jgi:hypothetical protein
MGNAYRIFVQKHEEKRPIERHKHGWEDNIEMDVKEIGRAVWTRFSWLSTGSVTNECSTKGEGFVCYR